MRTCIITLLTILTLGCATPKQVKKEAFVVVKFGSRGGFTGMGTQYLLKPNGKVYKEFSDSLSFLNQIEMTVVKDIKKQIVAIGLDTLKLEEKGNMTYFLEVQTSSYQNRVTWSDQTQNTGLRQLYRSLVKALEK